MGSGVWGWRFEIWGSESEGWKLEVWVWCLGFWVWGLAEGTYAEKEGWRYCDNRFNSNIGLTREGFRGSSIGFTMQGLGAGYWNSGSGHRISGLGYRARGLGFGGVARTADLNFFISGARLRYRVSEFEVRVSGSGFRVDMRSVAGFGFRGYPLGPGWILAT